MNWRVIFLCFLAQNLAVGLAYGSFGPLLPSNEAHFGISRSTASIGLSVVSLASAGLAPFLGAMLERAPLRGAMVAGAVLSATGYGLLALVNEYAFALAGYAAIGAGLCVLGLLAPVTLVNRAVEASRRGRVLGLAYMPVFQLVTPFLIGLYLAQLGRVTMLTAIGVAFLLLIPVILVILRREPNLPAPAARDSQAASADGTLRTSEILRSTPFWILSLGIGILSGSVTAMLVHIVPYAISLDMSLLEASSILSGYAAAGIAGTYAFGWLADRLSGPVALAVAALVQAMMWIVILNVDGFYLFLPVAVVGLCAAPMVTLHGAAIGQLFGSASVSRVMGMSYSVKIPFLFGYAPLVGLLYEMQGGYAGAFMLTAALLAVAAAAFVGIWRRALPATA